MDRVEQRIVLKFLFMKGLGNKTAHAELCSVLGEQARSLSRLVRRFKDGDLSCDHILHWNEISGPQCSSSRTEIQSRSFPDCYCTRIIQGKFERQAERRQETTGRPHGQFRVS
jgi:hypothetical protein